MGLRIVLLSSAYNGLSQRAWAELRERGHQVSVHVVADGAAIEAAVRSEQPDLVVAPMLKTAIPEDVWRRNTCLIVHPGIVGDRGPSSLDWAILDDERTWGVTVLQADREMDAGDIWASSTFAVRAVSKSQLYRHEVTDAACTALVRAVERFAARSYRPEPLDYANPDVRGRLRPSMRIADRAVEWELDTSAILRRVRSGDSAPGARAVVADLPVQLFGATREEHLRGRPGTLLAERDGAVCIATGDGAVWISHLRVKDHFKLPASWVLGPERLRGVPAYPLPLGVEVGPTQREITYRERNGVGYLQFDFYNGAMSTAQCDRLRTALVHAKQRPTRAIVLMGGSDIWSNGIHLNTIEAASDPALESWRNILAMNALVREVVLTPAQRVIAAMQGNAGAGGVILALAADEVWARRGIVLNPHYKGMGGLYGSEYWTYLLPRRVGEQMARELTEQRAPWIASGAARIGLVDAEFGDGAAAFRTEVEARAEVLADAELAREALARKQVRRASDEQRKPLEQYAAEELAHMHRNFFGPDRSYHEARRRFVYKTAFPCAAQP